MNKVVRMTDGTIDSLTTDWGALEFGRWAQVQAPRFNGPTVVGMCGRCGGIGEAVTLTWVEGSFGRDGFWTCTYCR